MASGLVPCPGCGRPVSRAALECPGCGVPVRVLLGPPSPGLHPVVIVLLVTGLVFGGAMLVGMVAAIAIPRLSGVSGQATGAPTEFSPADSVAAREAVRGLLALQALQADHQVEHGSYAGNLDDPAAPGYLRGWEDRSPAYRFEVARAEPWLCLVATPTAAGPPLLSMDGLGMLYVDPGCAGEPSSEDPRVDWGLAAPE